MIRVGALTAGKRTPSSRFRVRQHIGGLRELGIEVDEYVPLVDKHAGLPGWPEAIRLRYAGPLALLLLAAKLGARVPGVVGSWTHQVTWLSRELLPGCFTLEGLLKRPLVLDVDDAVWLSRFWGESALRRIAGRADVVVAGNSFIADWASGYCDDVEVVPTAVDCDRFKPAPERDPDDVRWFTVGWTGMASNYPYLAMLAEPLTRFLSERRDARLLIIAEKPPVNLPVPRERLLFVPWSERTEVRAVQSMDVGLMPLPDTPWARGKCSFKMLQYMACGLPVVVSPIGMNTEVLAMGDFGWSARHATEWYDALRCAYDNRDEARMLGQRGRMVAHHHFDRRLISQRLAGVFRQLTFA